MAGFKSITLVGGPCDGQSLLWQGGDVLQMQERAPVGLTVGWPKDAQPPRHTYRRSINTPEVFVFQP